MTRLGDEVWPHHEFTRGGGEIYCADLPIIWFKNAERLAEINAIYEAHGFTVYDAHVNVIEGNHMQPDYRHLAWKKRLDPKGLLNPGKSRAWEEGAPSLGRGDRGARPRNRMKEETRRHGKLHADTAEPEFRGRGLGASTSTR
jgi:hypothetical protein